MRLSDDGIYFVGQMRLEPSAEAIKPFWQVLGRDCGIIFRLVVFSILLTAFFSLGAKLVYAEDGPVENDLDIAELVQAYQDQAAVAFVMGEPQIAVRLYKDALSYYPENPEIYYRLAVVQESIGEIEEAIDSYESMKRVNPDGRWAGLARARLEVLRTRSAVRTLLSAEQMGRAGEYSEAERALRNAYDFSPAPAVRRRILERYYSYVASNITTSIHYEMNRRMYHSIAIAGFETTNAADRISADNFAEKLRNDILAGTRLEVLSGPVVRDSLLSIRMPVISEEIITEYPSFDFEINPVDCVVTGVWSGDELEVVLYDMRNGIDIMSRVIPLIGNIPPRHPALIWERFPSPFDTNPDIGAWVWSAKDRVEPDTRNVSLNIQVSLPAYVTLFLVMSDGSLELLIPSSSEPESYFRERQIHTIEVPAGRSGEVRGVWMIASRTSLFSWGEISNSASEPAHIILDRIISELPELPRRSWEVARWTWYVKDIETD